MNRERPEASHTVEGPTGLQGRRIGLFFGSFNPIHVGHLILADHISIACGLSRVRLVVSPHNPHKEYATLAHEHDRYEMARLACHDNPTLEPSDIELRLPRPNYTINTLEALMAREPGTAFELIMGYDNLVSLPRWHRYTELLGLTRLHVYPRLVAGQPSTALPEALRPYEDRINLIEGPQLAVSASLIRERIRRGWPTRYLLPEAVEGYIRLKKLYE